MLDMIGDVKLFIDFAEGVSADASRYYASDEHGYRFLIPDGRTDDGRISFTRVIYVEMERLDRETPLQVLKRVAETCTPKPKEELPWNISQTVYCFAVKEPHGFLKSKMYGRDLFLFFNLKKLSKEQVKFRIYKIVGRLLLKRAERIVERTREKIRRDPYGWVAKIVQFFREFGKKLVSIAERFIKPVVSVFQMMRDAVMARAMLPRGGWRISKNSNGCYYRNNIETIIAHNNETGCGAVDDIARMEATALLNAVSMAKPIKRDDEDPVMRKVTHRFRAFRTSS